MDVVQSRAALACQGAWQRRGFQSKAPHALYPSTCAGEFSSQGLAFFRAASRPARSHANQPKRCEQSARSNLAREIPLACRFRAPAFIFSLWNLKHGAGACALEYIAQTKPASCSRDYGQCARATITRAELGRRQQVASPRPAPSPLRRQGAFVPAAQREIVNER